MEENSLQLHEFFVEGGNAERSHTLLHITEPSTTEEKAKGYFFAVCEIVGSNASYIEELQQTIDVIEKGYYESAEQSNATALETTLDLVNKQSSHIIQRTIELHWMVGVISSSDIIFSFHGYPTIMLFYKNKEGLYHTLDLVATNPADRSSHTTVFPQIIQGKISPHDYLVITTPHVREFYDHDRLQRIITTRSPEESCRHLERSFQESKRELSFAGIIVTVGKTIERRPAPAPRLPQISQGSSESLQKLFSTQKNTSSTLTSSLSNAVHNGLSKITRSEQKNTSYDRDENSENEQTSSLRLGQSGSQTNRRQQKNTNKELPLHIIRLIIATLAKIARFLLTALLALLGVCAGFLRFLKTIFLALINYQGRRETIVSEWKRSLLSFRDHIFHLPLITKVFFCFTLILLVGVVIVIFYLNRQHAAVEATEFFNTTIKTINKKKDSADAALIYQDEATARKNFEEAQNLISQLSCATTKDSKQQEICKKLKTDLDDLAVKFRKLTITSAEQIVSWDQIGGKLSGLVKTGNLLITHTKNENTPLFTYNLLTKEPGTIALPSSTPPLSLSTTAPDKLYASLLTSTNELFSVNQKTLAIKKLSFTSPKPNGSLISILMYGNRIYMLDQTALQIYRFDSINGGFSRGVEWIKHGQEALRNAVSFAIDGDLYALKADGSIAKFTAGEPQAFGLQYLDPALTSGQSVYTYDGFNYLYILDSMNSRIIIARKSDGSIRAQLSTPELKEATSFVIEETNKLGYFLSGNKVYKIGLGI